MSFWEWLSEQFSQSTIISGVLALLIWVAVVYLAVAGMEIPEILYAGGMAVIGFFFGAKRGEMEGRARALRDYNFSGGLRDD